MIARPPKFINVDIFHFFTFWQVWIHSKPAFFYFITNFSLYLWISERM